MSSIHNLMTLKGIRNIALLVLLLILLFVLYSSIIERKSVIKNIATGKFKNNVVLDFKNANVKVVGWNNDYIQVRDNNHFISHEIPNLATNDSGIELVEYKKPTSLMYKIKTFRMFNKVNEYVPIDFEIRVPKDIVLDIHADFIRAINCTILFAEGENAYFKECNLIKNFNGKGDYIYIKRCYISHKHILDYKNVYFHDSSIDEQAFNE